jgi:uncharacterized protein (TIGR04141 family)
VLRRDYGNDVATEFREAMAAEEKWTVEFVIADSPRADGRFNIPFFSKISLRDETNILKAMGYDVCLRFITLEPDEV